MRGRLPRCQALPPLVGGGAAFGHRFQRTTFNTVIFDSVPSQGSMRSLLHASIRHPPQARERFLGRPHTNPNRLNCMLRFGLSRAPFWRGTVLSADKFQDSHLPQALTMLMQGGFKVFKNWSYFRASRYESLGTQFTDA